MYSFLGICLALAALLTVNAILSFLIRAAWRYISRLTNGWRTATRARLIFILQTFPAAAALLAVAVFLVPSYLAFEPRQTGEAVSLKLGLVAFLSATGIALAIWRGIRAWLATRRLAGNWQTHSQIVFLENLPIPAYRINHKFPVVAVIGVLRPKLFIANQIFDSLNDNELSAVIAHETAHVAACDNLKHWLMRICRDALVIIPSKHFLDKEWAEAIELAADEEAVNKKQRANALDLAQALIKIARHVPKGVTPTMPAGAFLIGSEVESGNALTQRIERLMELPQENTFHKNWKNRLANNFPWICFCLLILAVALTAANPNVLAAMHAAVERVVSVLS